MIAGLRNAVGAVYAYLMSKGKGRRDGNQQRRRAEFAELRQRASAGPAPARRERIQAVDITKNEEKYEALLLAIESALLEVYDERQRLPIDEEAERALRLTIARFEGDTGRRSGSPDVDAMADAINRHIELYFRRAPLLSRAEIIGALRRIISSINTWHTPENPRAYFDYVGDAVRTASGAKHGAGEESLAASGLWIPGQKEPREREDEAEPARRPGGLWLPGDR